MRSEPSSTWHDFGVWLRIGLMSFGGPAAQIGLMHREIVEKRNWLDERQYLNALSFCMLLPGPEAMQLATYAGWRRGGMLGGLMAGIGFVLPGALVIMALAITYVTYGQNHFLAALFLGIKAAVVIIVLHSLLRIARRTLTRHVDWGIAASAFIGIFMLGLPFPLILLLAGLIGVLAGNATPTALPNDESSAEHAQPERPKPLGTIVIFVAGLVLWLGPIVMLSFAEGETILPTLAQFFAKLAVVTFGGAYAVLAYMTQEVVNQYQWLNTPEMMDGLGLAETTPGPLILVTQFVGFIAGFRDSAGSIGDALAFGSLAAFITLWVTFVPCFLWIFSAGPYVEWIVSQTKLNAALRGITAAVVGVIANLSVWFALHVFFSDITTLEIGFVSILVPDPSSLDWRVLPILLATAFLLFVRQWDSWKIILVAASCGLFFGQF